MIFFKRKKYRFLTLRFIYFPFITILVFIIIILNITYFKFNNILFDKFREIQGRHDISILLSMIQV